MVHAHKNSRALHIVHAPVAMVSHAASLCHNLVIFNQSKQTKFHICVKDLFKSINIGPMAGQQKKTMKRKHNDDNGIESHTGRSKGHKLNKNSNLSDDDQLPLEQNVNNRSRS